MLTFLPLSADSGTDPGMDPITVLIAEAYILLRHALNEFLAQQKDIQVVSEAAEDLQCSRS
jgi:hypothetical protein